jgi:hypothetical protein
MKTNFITHEHFNKLVNVIVKKFPATKVTENTATDYTAWNWDFIVRANVAFIDRNGETSLLVGIPGAINYVWAHTPKEFKRVKKQLIAACRKYR